MKNTFLFIFIFFSSIFLFPQFSVNEKIEVQIIYPEAPYQKPLSIELLSSEDDKDFSFSQSINDGQDRYIFYDVIPGKYYLGLDFKERMFMIEVLVGSDIDSEGNVFTSYTVPNEIEVSENRNLKVALTIENSLNYSGFKKNTQKSNDDFDFIGMTFFVEPTYADSDENTFDNVNE